MLFLAFVGSSLDYDLIQLVFPRNTVTGDTNKVSTDADLIYHCYYIPLSVKILIKIA